MTLFIIKHQVCGEEITVFAPMDTVRHRFDDAVPSVPAHADILIDLMPLQLVGGHPFHLGGHQRAGVLI